MNQRPSIAFAKFSGSQSGVNKKGTVFVLAADEGGLSDVAKPSDPGKTLERAFPVAEFTGKFASTVEVLAPQGASLDRLVAIGTGKVSGLDEYAWLKLGGTVAASLRKATEVAVVLDVVGASPSAKDAASLAAGILLRSYSFDKYKTRKDKDDGKAEPKKPVKVTIHTADPAAAKKAFADAEAVIDGVLLARDLVNEPANVLGPVEFAARAKELEALGVKVEILAEKEMKKLGMGSLLGVAQGSPRGARMAIMQWNGGKPKDSPIAFVGKGVTFDTGGNSIKPASGMEDMKGDMGGAAAVTGLMHALAARKAKANVVGIIGLVENAVDGHAQRPGDIVTSMSGQTIEVLNTDAEGRLVLADALWYCNDRFQPKFMVNLATLTGAIMVALGQHYAGLFSNNDELAEKLSVAGQATQERLWRMPLGAEYDKLIDSKNADMKNIGGRFGGATIAAQFLQRFVKDTPWAHLDIAGTAMGAPSNEINQSWGSGFGVRLLDRLVRDNYEQ
ncbi:leucyl aminopeptidase [Mesorhizobium sp. M7A.F.Ca.CA.002.10.1.1]|uniref:Probable cytosol aminopeptidase n=1 Tax=Mesorhizobium ciceri biovar biserrulae (strain HAMBI 2942 / LMG 23838 / WSM1271) TaxID=765698 RepID=E8TKM8_MESCW|nr:MULTISPECIES: leucyl aminopeptidase [Mesorhizobium]ADV13848.1 Leucyl aminopeptidase [Mesorhizobium ciceri biovar biserrulae WSM1271]AMX97006.1 leucyl aminopeptidase [Mesorhizobium ciceri]MDF3210274.1 leucyl aminopeptidase [Mesorhizobium sp. LMG15046]MDF3231303.1 leucyl aminopeptidase [Mesorhizobium sp. DSM 30133]RUU20739.1 leucyl aminopeptidase [Mesorhizobium sp. Primo-B]